jgi:hypothetical protein
MIDVMELIIAAATPKHSGHCMIADAVYAAVPGAKSVSVDLATIRWTDPSKGLRYTYLTPRPAQLALLDFDQGRTVKPFRFELRNPMVTLTAAGRRKRAGMPDKPRLEHRKEEKSKGASVGTVPARVGGSTPPRGALASGGRIRVGKRREFGLRQLSR